MRDSATALNDLATRAFVNAKERLGIRFNAEFARRLAEVLPPELTPSESTVGRWMAPGDNNPIPAYALLAAAELATGGSVDVLVQEVVGRPSRMEDRLDRLEHVVLDLAQLVRERGNEK